MALIIVFVLSMIVSIECQFASQHVQNLQQSHLPQDPNVLRATQEFLQKFNTLAARTNSAPKTAVHSSNNHMSPHQKVTFGSHIQQNIPRATTKRPVPTTTQPSFSHFLPNEPINESIRQLHQTLARTNTNHQAPNQQQFANNQFQQHNSQQNNNQHQPQVNNNQQLSHQNNHQQPSHQNNNHNPSHVNNHGGIPIMNQFGHIINPNRFPGPLADDVPAGVNGPIQQIGPTFAVHEAQQQLAQAHQSILAHHALLPKTVENQQ